jgi:hypothetical protein
MSHTDTFTPDTAPTTTCDDLPSAEYVRIVVNVAYQRELETRERIKAFLSGDTK